MCHQGSAISTLLETATFASWPSGSVAPRCATRQVEPDSGQFGVLRDVSIGSLQRLVRKLGSLMMFLATPRKPMSGERCCQFLNYNFTCASLQSGLWFLGWPKMDSRWNRRCRARRVRQRHPPGSSIEASRTRCDTHLELWNPTAQRPRPLEVSPSYFFWLRLELQIGMPGFRNHILMRFAAGGTPRSYGIGAAMCGQCNRCKRSRSTALNLWISSRRRISRRASLSSCATASRSIANCRAGFAFPRALPAAHRGSYLAGRR